MSAARLDPEFSAISSVCPSPVRAVTLLGSVSRKAGGLFESVRRLSQSIASEPAFDVRVFGLADEYAPEDIGAWAPLATEAFPVRGPVAFGYSPAFKRALLASDAHLLHVHGIWMYSSVAAVDWHRHTGRPYLVSPRGMLEPWSLKHSPWKKRMAILFYEQAHLQNAACIHALCEAEAQSIRAFGLRNPVCVIPNGIDLPAAPPACAPPWADHVEAGQKVLFFLSRLHPKKGLPHLIEAWAQVRRQAEAAGWRLVIAGWDQGGHEAGLKDAARRMNLESSVVWAGPQHGEHKAACFHHADAFILPSFSEGLPMAVLEAWAHGLPTLITPECHLPEGFAADAALRIQTDTASIADGLRTLFSLSDANRRQLGSRARQLAAGRFFWPRIAQEMRHVYHWMLEGGPAPACVWIN